jgi:hypothetical protein
VEHGLNRHLVATPQEKTSFAPAGASSASASGRDCILQVKAPLAIAARLKAQQAIHHPVANLCKRIADAGRLSPRI